MKRPALVFVSSFMFVVALFWQGAIALDVARAEAQAKGNPGAKPNPKAQAKPQTKQKPQPKTQAKPKPQHKAQQKPQQQPKTKPQSQTKPKVQKESKGKQQQSKPKPQPKQEGQKAAKPKTKQGPKPKAAAKPAPKPKPNAQAKSQPQPKGKASVQAKPKSVQKQVASQPPKPASSTVLKDAPWAEYHYKLARGPRSKHFNLSFALKPSAPGKALNARVLLNAQDDQNYYFVQFANNEVQIGRVEGGIEWPIGAKSSFDFGKGAADVLIKRRTSDIAVFVNGQVRARAYDNTFSGGQMGFGSIGGSAAFRVSKPQPIGEVYFADDFMRVSGELGDWEVVDGEWDVTAIRNPTKSANAFSFAGAAKGKAPSATVVAGYPFWDNYSLKLALRSEETRAIGAYFYYLDANNYYLFKWSGRVGGEGRKQLIKKFHGKETILAEAKGGYHLKQWYELRIDSRDNVVAVFIDDHPIFRVADVNLCSGKVGLYTECKKPVKFDDVLVTGITAFADDFSRPVLGKWIYLGGEWRVVETPHQKAPSSKNGVLRVDASGAAKAVCGEASWHDYRFSVDVQRLSPSGARADLGVAFYYLDEASYYLWRQRSTPAKNELVKVVNGKEHVIAASDGQTIDGNRRRITADVDRGVITILVDAKKVCEAWDPGLRGGRVGLYAAKGAVSFDNATVDFRNQELTPISTRKEIFSAEQSMSNWSAAKSDWIEKKEKIGDSEVAVSWHRANIPGDVEVVVELEKEVFAAPKGEVKLIIGASSETVKSGYAFAVSKSESTWTAKLFREGQLKAEKALPKLQGPSALALRRKGAFVVGYIDESPAALFKDAQPLKGDKVACFASSGGLKVENTKVFCDNVLFDNFDKACTEWRQAGGTWEITNRWQCDPRWSFFSGWPKVQGMKKSGGGSDKKENRAILWHKRQFNGDVTLEFAAGVKMDYAARPNYALSRDLNATICADGKSLTSGYSFVFAGWGNQKTGIVRGTKIVAETEKPRIEGSIHRRWWYFKIEKKGGHLRYWIDNQLVLEYDDPKPLTGNRIAIWTYDSGIMLSMVRIACAGETPKESPEVDVPQVCQCFYDIQQSVAKK